MTIIEAINITDAIKPNGYAREDKVRWLSTLDGIIKREIIDTHEDGEDVVFDGYEDKIDLETELLVPAPFDDIYLRWLESRIDYANGEYRKYNNSVTMYNTDYDAFRNFYNRNHMPKGKERKYFS